jgi:hypothetical protein
MGIEPTTYSLATNRSTAELVPQAADQVARLLHAATHLRQQADVLERMALDLTNEPSPCDGICDDGNLCTRDSCVCDRLHAHYGTRGFFESCRSSSCGAASCDRAVGECVMTPIHEGGGMSRAGRPMRLRDLSLPRGLVRVRRVVVRRLDVRRRCV